MRYMGGKSRIAKYIATEINKVRKPGQLVWDAFCGGLSVSVALSKHGPVLSTDANAALISLYKAVKSGWSPPETATREQRDQSLALPDTDPMKAFLRIGCGFSGNWASGFAHSKGRNYANETRSSLLRDLAMCRWVAAMDFLSVLPVPTRAIIYCDIPYRGTTQYDGAPSFDHDRFISLVSGWSRFTDVFVSEYDFPVGSCVWDRQQITTVSRNKDKYRTATERLYHLPKGSTW
jgi:DNA adenine methylase